MGDSTFLEILNGNRIMLPPSWIVDFEDVRCGKDFESLAYAVRILQSV
jgi:hypothetical protein